MWILSTDMNFRSSIRRSGSCPFILTVLRQSLKIPAIWKQIFSIRRKRNLRMLREWSSQWRIILLRRLKSSVSGTSCLRFSRSGLDIMWIFQLNMSGSVKAGKPNMRKRLSSGKLRPLSKIMQKQKPQVNRRKKKLPSSRSRPEISRRKIPTSRKRLSTRISFMAVLLRGMRRRFQKSMTKSER